jgi:mannose-6-phosphate isomerase-like protein (cupin superfamily)
MEKSIRPWGSYTVLSQKKVAGKVIEQLKTIEIKRNSSLSLQFHNGREELWTILSGKAKVIIGDDTFEAKKGDTFSIPKKVIHRAITSDSPVVISEISKGDVDEEDIVRLEDEYNRI